MREAVMFKDPWCGACRSLEPVAASLGIRVVDVSEDREAGDRARICTLPTFIVYEDGKEVYRRDGAMSPYEMRKMVEEE